MISDRVGDFIIRLQNAAMAGKREVVTPRSNHLVEIAKKLRELGFLESVKDGDRAFTAALAYGENGAPRLRGVKRLSTPGRRLYAGHQDAHRVKAGTGARVISSSKGVITDAEARANRLGGEELFKIW